MVRTKRKITYPLSNIVKFDVFVQSILVQTSHFGFNMHSIAYLVTWKRGALMPTRTTIFFCSTSRSTRGRWQPVQVFFGSKLNQTQHWRMCSRVLPDFLPKILSLSRGQKFALMNCVSVQMTFLWSFFEFLASISSLREQAFLFFYSLRYSMQTLIFIFAARLFLQSLCYLIWTIGIPKCLKEKKIAH